MSRFEERKKDYNNALSKLKQGLTKEMDDLYIDGILQRFEFTFELAWKVIKDVLEYQGIQNKIGSPREIIQLGYKYNLITNGEQWIEMMLSRNSLSHLYDEKTSRQIYIKIKDEYIKLFDELKEQLEII